MTTRTIGTCSCPHFLAFLVSGVLLVAAAVAGVWRWTTWERVYEGKPLSFWSGQSVRVAPCGFDEYMNGKPLTHSRDMVDSNGVQMVWTAHTGISSAPYAAMAADSEAIPSLAKALARRSASRSFSILQYTYQVLYRLSIL